MENYNKMQSFKILCKDALDQFIEEELEEPLNYEKLKQKEKLRKPMKRDRDGNRHTKRRNY